MKKSSFPKIILAKLNPKPWFERPTIKPAKPHENKASKADPETDPLRYKALIMHKTLRGIRRF